MLLYMYNCTCMSYTVSEIKKIHARQIFDSRGNPTVEVDIVTDKGKYDRQTDRCHL